MPSRVIATGRALPKQTVTNAELSERLGISASEIVRKTGVQSRFWIAPGEAASSLAVAASRAALASASLSPDVLDLILVSTTTPDMYFPSTACLLQRDLGIAPIPAFDINASCSGFLYALSIADQYLSSGEASTILLVASDVKSRFLDLEDPATAILFGDGAGAVILSRCERGLRKIQLGADGSHHKLVYLPAGGSRAPLTQATLAENKHTMKMDGKRLFRIAVNKMVLELKRFLEESSLSIDDINHFVFHQANVRILEAVFKRMSIPAEKSPVTLSQFGNTSSASIPMALDVLIREGRLKKGDRVLLSAFGGGITWGNALIDW